MNDILQPKKFTAVVFMIMYHLTSIAQEQGRIIMNGATMKMVNGAYVSTRDLTIVSGNVIADSSTIKIAGNITNGGIFDLRNGTLEMNGTAPQVIPANSITYNTLKNLVASNDFSLAGQDSVTGVLSFGANDKTITTAGFLTLKSTAARTARLADITNAGTTSGNTIIGNVHVERYISATRAWRLLTAPISGIGAQTINQAWQEGVANASLSYPFNQNPLPGFGMHITGGTTANGFDPGVNSTTALKKYTGSVWSPVPNTNVTPVTSQSAFMVFFRGNRSAKLSMGIYAPVTSSVLRSTGSLKINDQSFPVAATGFTVIGNPYAAPINFNQIAKSNSTNIQDNFYLWDPKLTGSAGVGAYVNVSWGLGSYDITPSGEGTSGLNQYIQSGSGFLVKTADGVTPGTLIIKERDKATVNINANRGAGGNTTAKLKTNLYGFNADGTVSLVDGILNSYDDNFSNGIDNYDAVKLINTNESLFSIRSGVPLIVERKQPVTDADTIFVNLLKTQARSYKFEITGENFSDPGLTAVLEDSYTNIHTALDLAGKTEYKYNVVNIPGSWIASRFRIVFKQVTVLPVTLNTIKATAKNDDIIVAWTVENEFNIKQYDIERSADGRKFNTIAAVPAKGSNNSTLKYQWLDNTVLSGNNYYRIKSFDINGEINYSSIVKVFMGKGKPGIILTTNVIQDNTIHLQMNNMPEGSYAARITTTVGQMIYATKIEHPGGSSAQNIYLIEHLAAGIYNLDIVKPDGSAVTIKMFIQ